MTSSPLQVPSPSPGGARRGEAPWIALVAAAALITAIAAHWLTLTQPYVVNNDSQQHGFWMHSLQDPELFQEDLLARYSRGYQPSGYRMLFHALAQVTHPVAATRYLPLLLFVASAVLLYLLMTSFSGRFEGLLAVALFLVSPFFLQKMAGAHPRAFATPFVLLTLLFLVRRRPYALAGLLVVVSLFYPMMFVLCAATAVLSLLRFEGWRPGLELRPRFWAPLLVALLVGGGGLALRYLKPSDPSMGPLVSRVEMEASPEFYAGGRGRHLPLKGLVRTTEQVVRQGLLNSWVLVDDDPIQKLPQLQFYGMLGLSLLAAVAALRRRGFVPFPLAALALCSLALFLSAEVLLLRLFFPRRYVMYSIPLLLIIAVALGMGILIRRLPGPTARRLVQAIALAGVLAHAPGMASAGLDDYSAHAELYRWAEGLPKKTLIAGHPEVLEGIPLFAARRVLATEETSNPYFVGYWRRMEERLYSLFDAYYGEDLETLRNLVERYEIDYLVVDETTFEPEFFARPRRGAYFQPFGAYIDELTADGHEFALLQLAKRDRVFESTDGHVWAVAVAEVFRHRPGGDLEPVTPPEAIP